MDDTDASSRTLDSAPSSPHLRSNMQTENKRLRLEVLELRLEIARLQEANGNSSAPTTPTGARRQPPIRCLSDVEPDLMMPEELVEAVVDPDMDKFESARGLKHRKGVMTPPRLKPVKAAPSGNYDALPSGDDLECAIVKEPPVTPATVSESSEESLIVLETTPVTTFGSVIQDRAGWLVGLLILQSMSSFIIARNETLLQSHLVIVRFLTMLVGAGGNAGNQASVGVIRGLAVGDVHDGNLKETLTREVYVGLALSFVLGVAGAFRAAVFATPFTETIAITTSLVSIVFISVVLGSTLPLVMKFLRIDPAHSSTSIQVIMDILGVLITVHVSGAILGSKFDKWISGDPL